MGLPTKPHISVRGYQSLSLPAMQSLELGEGAGLAVPAGLQQRERRGHSQLLLLAQGRRSQQTPRRPLPQAVTSVHSACQVGVDLGPASPIWGQDEAEAALSSWQNLSGTAGPQQSKAPDTRVPQQLPPTGRALLSWSPQSHREPWAGVNTLG